MSAKGVSYVEGYPPPGNLKTRSLKMLFPAVWALNLQAVLIVKMSKNHATGFLGCQAPTWGVLKPLTLPLAERYYMLWEMFLEGAAVECTNSFYFVLLVS